MSWSPRREAYLEAIRSLPDLTLAVQDLAAPGLDAWNVAGLAGHLLRGVLLPLEYLTAAVPGMVAALDGPGYILAYLNARADDPVTMDESIRQRGEDAATFVDPGHLHTTFVEAVAEAGLVLGAASGEEVLDTRFGGLTLNDYLHTRNMEVVVHGLDLARAIGSRWTPPLAATLDAVELLVAVTARRGRAPDLLLALTGRDAAAHGVLPLLQ